jgi:polyhydroxyalkanoate synthesis regulator phasin
MTQKKEARESSTTQTNAGFGLTDLVDVSRETSMATYRAAVQTQKAADKMIEKMIEAGTTSQEAGLQFTRAYLQNMNQARQEWLNQANQVTERLLTASPTAFDYPFKNEVDQINDGIAQGARLVIDAFFAPLKAAARR